MKHRIKHILTEKKDVIRITILLVLVGVVTSLAVFMGPRDGVSDFRITAQYAGFACSGCTILTCSTYASSGLSGSCSGYTDSHCVTDNSGNCVETHTVACDAWGSWSYTASPSCGSCETLTGSYTVSGWCNPCGNSPISAQAGGSCEWPSCTGENICYAPGGQTSCSGFNGVQGTDYCTYSGPGSGTCGCDGSTSNLCCTKSCTPLPDCECVDTDIKCGTWEVSGPLCITKTCYGIAPISSCEQCVSNYVVPDPTKDIIGSNGVCGSADGATTSTVPVSNLCSVGASSGVSTYPTSYNWTCYGTAGACAGASGGSVGCSASRIQPPVYTGFELRNSANTVVAAEAGNLNHVCQTIFTGRGVRYVVTATDPDGLSDIASVQLRVGGQTYVNSYAANFTGTAIFDVVYSAVVSSTTTIIEVNITDSSSLTTGWGSVGRSFKIWDCSVPVSGTLYDGSLAVFEVISCADGSADFVSPVESSVEYLLNFQGTLIDTSNKSMTVNSPSYTSNSNSLYWGAQYKSEFTNVTGGIPMYKRPGSVGTCNSADTPFVIDNINVDPYAANPTLTVNYSVILNHFPWYQVSGGGIVAKESITDSVPDSCLEACVPNISKNTIIDDDINNIISQSGLIAAETINKGTYGEYSQSANWNVAKDIFSSNYSYKYFYNEYFAKLGQGKVYDTGTSMSQILLGTGGTGVVFVNGDLTIDSDNTVNTGEFLMLVVSDDIDVLDTVGQVQGVLITDGNLTSTGSSDLQLRIDGSIYSKNNVSLTRDFNLKTYNNRNPAILVTNRPDFIFSMPGRLTKILSGWKEGI